MFTMMQIGSVLTGKGEQTMPDREKVINALDICLGHGKCDDCGYRIKGGYSTMDCRKPMMRDALALLKEQQNQIWEMQDRTEYLEDKLKEQPQIVRCNNCKKRYTVLCIQEEAGNINNQDDWFCADGVRRE